MRLCRRPAAADPLIKTRFFTLTRYSFARAAAGLRHSRVPAMFAGQIKTGSEHRKIFKARL
jgi:hypothetical protein